MVFLLLFSDTFLERKKLILFDYQLLLVLGCVFLYFFIFTFAGTFLLQFNPKHYSQITLHLSTCISEQSDSSLKSKPCTTLFGIKFLNYYYHLISSLLRIQLSCKIQTFHILRQSTRKFKPTHILYPFTTSVGLMIGIFLSFTIFEPVCSDALVCWFKFSQCLFVCDLKQSYLLKNFIHTQTQRID